MKRLRIKIKTCYVIWLFLVILICLINWRFTVFPVHFTHVQGNLKVLTYNVHSTGSNFEKDASRIAMLILNAKPDFVYLTEYYEKKGCVLDSILKISYSYSYTKHRWGQNEGDAFYSKWKIDSVCRFFVNGERIMAYRVQVSHASDTIAMYCCHFASNNADSQSITWESIKKGYHKRSFEVEEILRHIRNDKYPCIIMGDMNDISGSPSLNAIENAGFEDAWWNGGLGYGSTFHDGWLMLRIDHILYDKNFDLCDVRVLNADYSDHDALVGSFNLKRYK